MRPKVLALFFAFLLLPIFASADVLYRPLYVGTKGEDVSYLQTFLKAAGYFTYPTITGFFGSFTWQAVADFQSANNLERVGIVGPLTRALINGSSTTPPTSPTASSTSAQPVPTIPPPIATTYCPFAFCPTGNYTPGFGGGAVSTPTTNNTVTDGVPTNATLQAMLTGTTGNHAAIPHGVPSGYDWYSKGRMGDGVTPQGGRTYLEPWGQVFLADGETIDTDDVIEVSNLRLYIKFYI
jgi:peptidoglycan hydrolase-like protein with peptidoglycan-binding domain